MSLTINYNVSAMISNNALKLSDQRLSASLARLSSGFKINEAKDNAAGLAIARRMNAQIRGLDVAAQDAKDGISVVEIADGALAEVHDMLQRMNELAIKSANGTMSEEDRGILNKEVDALKEEIVRISKTTEYNGQKLLDGSFDLKGYTDNEDIKVNYYSDKVPCENYALQFEPVFDAEGNITSESTATVTNEKGEVTQLQVEYGNDQVIFTAENDFEIRLGLKEGWDADIAAGNATAINANLDLTGIGAMTLQIGANEGQVIDIRIPEVSLLNAGIEDMDLLTEENAKKAINQIGDAIAFVSEVRSRMGAYQNRLEHTQTNLGTSSENMTAAYSRIMDTDMATEMTKYTNEQVVSQAATSILAQANERPSQMLQLLQ